MITRTDRRRFPVLIAAVVTLALAGAALGLLFSWDDPGDTGIAHHQVLRLDVDARTNGQFVVIDGDTGSAPTQYFDHSVDQNMRYAHRVIAVNP